MARPSREEYENAKREYSNYCAWAQMARARQGELIEILAKTREDELLYAQLANDRYEIILAYQVIEAEKKQEDKP